MLPEATYIEEARQEKCRCDIMWFHSINCFQSQSQSHQRLKTVNILIQDLTCLFIICHATKFVKSELEPSDCFRPSGMYSSI